VYCRERLEKSLIVHFFVLTLIPHFRNHGPKKVQLLVELSLSYGRRSVDQSWYRVPLWGPWLVLSLSVLQWQLLCCSSCRAPSLTRGRVCNLQSNCRLVRSLRTNNHTLPSHLRLCSLFVASYYTERPPLVGEVIASFLRIESATWSAWRIPTAVFSVF
jgi:hypothetical protein